MHATAKPLGVQYDFYLDFGITDPEAFYDFYAILQEASQYDVVMLHINSPGGRIDIMSQVITAIATTEATVVGCAEGEVSSAAAFIFFACHTFQVAQFSRFLLHNGMGGAIGKPNDNLASAESHNDLVRIIIQETLGRFFTKKEIKKILQGKEHFLSGEEVANRINAALEKEGESE